MRDGRLPLAVFVITVACNRPAQKAPADSAFAALQTRGAAVVGVDQYASAHVFEDRPDGGRIVLDMKDTKDTASIRAIRSHMREIVVRFSNGDFQAPGLVHAQKVPGTDVMAANRDRITYAVGDRPGGAEVRIFTKDSATIAAVHEFLAFQRKDHRAAGHESHAGHDTTP
jgi:hypothetical protein